jgi:hypothetical protein
MRKIGITVLACLCTSTAFANQVPAKVVQVASVERTEIAPTVAVPGTIYSRNDVQITAGIAGQLLMVAEPGTIVQQGDAVARIDKRPLLLQRAEQETLLQRAEINIRQLESQLRRQRELQGSNLVSEFELEQTEANRDLALNDADITKVRIRQIDDQIRRADVRAPFTGVVIERMHRSGEDVGKYVLSFHSNTCSGLLSDNQYACSQRTQYTRDRFVRSCRPAMFGRRLSRHTLICPPQPAIAGRSANWSVSQSRFERVPRQSLYPGMPWYFGIMVLSSSALARKILQSALLSKSVTRPETWLR